MDTLEEKKELPAPQPKPVNTAEDDDELDELDDVLDEFSTTTTVTKPNDDKGAKEKAAEASGPGRPEVIEDAHLPAPDNDFLKALETGMAELLSQIDSSPGLQEQFNDIMKDMDVSTAPNSSSPSTTQPSSAATQQPPQQPSTTTKPKTGESFQDKIRQTIERMQHSDDQADAATTSSATNAADDDLAQILQELEASGLDGEGGEEELNKMLLGMMEQLTNKDILYEPMKELHDKFPAWMEKNKASLSETDAKRYEEQRRIVADIVARFERSEYSDENAGDREYIVDKMQKMQEAGAPPPDLVGDMNAAQEALGDINQCPQQ